MSENNSSGVSKSPPKKDTPALTETQAEVLQFIKQKCELTGVPPSFREIQKHFGYKAVGTVQDHVKALIQKGHLERPDLFARKKRHARALVPAGFRAEPVKSIPIYGEIAAGSTRETDQIELGSLTIAVPVAKDPCFALRVVGDSMIEVGIMEGDVLIVEREAEIKNADIVVALLHGETTVKRYVEKNGDIFLVPENMRMMPIQVTHEHFSIQGKVVGLQRRY